MAKTIPVRVGDRDRPHWLPWSAVPFPDPLRAGATPAGLVVS